MLGAMPDALQDASARCNARTDERTNERRTTPTPPRDQAEVSNAHARVRGITGLGGWTSFDWGSLPGGHVGPRRFCPAGWLYVAEFSFGVVKVGQTIAPRGRLQQHAKDATRFDGTMTRFWLSPEHPQWMSNELLLLGWCFEHGRQTFGEYFADLSYDEVTSHAETLDLTTAVAR